MIAAGTLALAVAVLPLPLRAAEYLIEIDTFPIAEYELTCTLWGGPRDGETFEWRRNGYHKFVFEAHRYACDIAILTPHRVLYRVYRDDALFVPKTLIEPFRRLNIRGSVS